MKGVGKETRQALPEGDYEAADRQRLDRPIALGTEMDKDWFDGGQLITSPFRHALGAIIGMTCAALEMGGLGRMILAGWFHVIFLFPCSSDQR